MNAGSKGFLDIVAERARRTPAEVVLRLAGDEGADVELDYGGLHERVERLGGALAGAALGAGRRIAICMENRPAWPVAYLAAWRAGAVTVPIDPALEAHAIRRVLAHSEAVVVLTSLAMLERLREAVEGLAAPPLLLNVDGGGRRWDGEPRGGGIAPATGDGRGAELWDDFVARSAPPGAQAASGALDAAAPATIMYTSGTTGEPKGVMLSHAGLFENVSSGLARIDFRAGDHVLGVLPLFHALPLMANFLAPIVAGGEVTYLVELNPDRIIAAFPRFGITTFACVPLFFYRFHDRVTRRLAAAPPTRRRIARGLLRLNRLTRRFGINLGRRLFAAAHAPFGPRLRTFLTGGAKFDPAVYRDFLDLGFNLVQGYGLTEATAILTGHPPSDLRPDTVGPPVDGVRLRIAEPDAEGVGEIQALTPSRMIGYYREPEATRASFDGDWLRTGDLGRITTSGHLQVTGRAKDVIVLASGKNIYPEELEAYYGGSEFIEEICILGLDDPARKGAERLHAVIVPNLDHARGQGNINVREMVKWEIEGLGLELPSPQRVTSLEIRMTPLPRTTTRKLKRFELRREVLAARATAASAGAESESVDAVAAEADADAERDEPPWAAQVRALVARFASTPTVRREQHLDLDLGLESLDRVEIQAELESSLGLDLPRERAAEVQTVGDLLDLVGAYVGVDGSTREAGSDRWSRVLAETPPDIEPYLRSRPLTEAALFALLRCARGGLRLSGYRCGGVERLPTAYPFILAPNHLSFVDPFLLAASLPHRVYRRLFFVGYSAYFEGPLRGAAARLLRTVPIDQNQQLERAMQVAAEGLRREMVLGIFPEGARSGDGATREFRRGVGILARALDIPVVPVGIWGTFEMWPREGRPRPHRTAVVFGEPMRVRGVGRAGEERFVQRLRERVGGLANQARALFHG